MAFDEENMELEEEFPYRDRTVRIFRTFRGAKHCRIEHEASKRFCDGCGTPIEPILCFAGYVENNHVALGSTPKEAADRTKKFIDFAEDSNSGGRKGGKPPDDDGDKDKKPPDESEEEDADKDEDEDEDDEEEGPPDSNGKRNLPPKLEKIVKLGWPSQLKALAQKVAPKPVLPPPRKKS